MDEIKWETNEKLEIVYRSGNNLMKMGKKDEKGSNRWNGSNR